MHRAGESGVNSNRARVHPGVPSTNALGELSMLTSVGLLRRAGIKHGRTGGAGGLSPPGASSGGLGPGWKPRVRSTQSSPVRPSRFTSAAGCVLAGGSFDAGMIVQSGTRPEIRNKANGTSELLAGERDLPMAAVCRLSTVHGLVVWSRPVPACAAAGKRSARGRAHQKPRPARWKPDGAGFRGPT